MKNFNFEKFLERSWEVQQQKKIYLYAVENLGKISSFFQNEKFSWFLLYSQVYKNYYKKLNFRQNKNEQTLLFKGTQMSFIDKN